VEGTLSFS
jgi:hypothetical protein